jgi:hypothetical protein
MNAPATKQTSNIDQGKKASPDWLKSQKGEGRRKNTQQLPGENFVELKYRSLENVAESKLASGLGIFSIALGIGEVLMPTKLGELTGVDSKLRAYLPLLGAREISHGIGILAGVKPTTAVWTRVGGDAIDLAFIGAAMAAKNSNKKRLIFSTLAILGVGALDLFCAKKLAARTWSENDGNPNAPTTVGQSSARTASFAA